MLSTGASLQAQHVKDFVESDPIALITHQAQKEYVGTGVAVRLSTTRPSTGTAVASFLDNKACGRETGSH
jgi:hypothetical protein